MTSARSSSPRKPSANASSNRKPAIQRTSTILALIEISSLLQWFNLNHRLAGPGQIPVGEQLISVKHGPLDDQCQGFGREAASDCSWRINPHFGGVRSIVSVEMRWVVIIVEHGYDDSIKYA